MVKRVLLVDDEPDIPLLFKTIVFSVDEWNVDVAEDGEIALNYLDDNTYDIIICDYDMPIKNGLDVLYEMDEKHRKSFYFYTANDIIKDEALSYEIAGFYSKMDGFDAFIKLCEGFKV